MTISRKALCVLYALVGIAAFVGTWGNEWKGQDLYVGDRVRVEMTTDGRLVRQITVLPEAPRSWKP